MQEAIKRLQEHQGKQTAAAGNNPTAMNIAGGASSALEDRIARVEAEI